MSITKNREEIELIRESALLVSKTLGMIAGEIKDCLLYTSPSPRDRQKSRMPSSA